jgi:hypothetical protein
MMNFEDEKQSFITFAILITSELLKKVFHLKLWSAQLSRVISLDTINQTSTCQLILEQNFIAYNLSLRIKSINFFFQNQNQNITPLQITHPIKGHTFQNTSDHVIILIRIELFRSN